MGFSTSLLVYVCHHALSWFYVGVVDFIISVMPWFLHQTPPPLRSHPITPFWLNCRMWVYPQTLRPQGLTFSPVQAIPSLFAPPLPWYPARRPRYAVMAARLRIRKPQLSARRWLAPCTPDVLRAFGRHYPASHTLGRDPHDGLFHRGHVVATLPRIVESGLTIFLQDGTSRCNSVPILPHLHAELLLRGRDSASLDVRSGVLYHCGQVLCYASI